MVISAETINPCPHTRECCVSGTQSWLRAHLALNVWLSQVHYAACGALKNISYGKDSDNKIAIKNCDGVPALIRLLRKTRDQDLTDIITGWRRTEGLLLRCEGKGVLINVDPISRPSSGTLWNLSSHDSIKMEIVDHALHALSDEVMVPHSGWEKGSNGAGAGEENCKPRHLEWETALTNTAGCLRYAGTMSRRRTQGGCM